MIKSCQLSAVSSFKEGSILQCLKADIMDVMQ